MLCDIVSARIKIGDSCETIEKILGYGCSECNIDRHKIIPAQSINLNDIFFRIVYRVGYNASGICYFVLVFDKNKKYLRHYRAVAQ
jgi:hypothetical protein